jgi:hypothetical protein
MIARIKARIKVWIIKLFKIQTYEKEYTRLAGENISLAKDLELTRSAYYSLLSDYEELKEMAKDPIGYINDQTKALEERYRTCMVSCENVAKEAEERLARFDREIHRAYANGRQDAYAEMGIRNIEAHEHGNILIQLPNGEIVEQILGLGTVNPSVDGVVSDDEILIDDLVEVEE